MTWEEQFFAYFDDLEQQAESVFGAERALEVAERAAGEYARVTAASRLMASLGLEVVVGVAGVGAVSGILRRVADGWCLVEGPRQWLVRTAAIGSVRGLSDRSVPEAAWPVTAKLGFGSALRRVGETGGECQVRLLDGGSHDVRLLRVGADFVEVLLGDSGETAVIWFTSIAAVQQRV